MTLHNYLKMDRPKMLEKKKVNILEQVMVILLRNSIPTEEIGLIFTAMDLYALELQAKNYLEIEKHLFPNLKESLFNEWKR